MRLRSSPSPARRSGPAPRRPPARPRRPRTTTPIHTSTPRRGASRRGRSRPHRASRARHTEPRHTSRRRRPDRATASLELALIRREQTFDVATKQRAEDERETNVLREMAMAQLKKDDENPRSGSR